MMTIKKGMLFLLMLAAAGCSRPKVIPDDELAMIFRDAFLSNSYLSKERINTDSLRVYGPIFSQYGYTATDVEHTIGNFSKRKSARLSDVVEKAIGLLDEEGAYYDREVSILDTINNASRRALTRIIYTDTLIRVSRLQDTSHLRVVVSDVHPGEYNISFSYEIDSLDRNDDLRGGVWMEQEEKAARKNRNIYLMKNRNEPIQRMLTADSSDRRLILDLWSPSKAPKRPSITVHNLRIRYTPPTPAAIDSFYRQSLNIRIFSEEFYRHAMQKDSL